MCGIIGYVGKKPAAPILLDGLSRLEYRGYDSAGIVTVDDSVFHLERTVGRIKNLLELTNSGKDINGVLGIGHTRWATHGKATIENAHPHISYYGKVAIVHNGIIDNYKEIKAGLMEKGFKFKSDTDSEVIADLVEDYYLKTKNETESIIKALGLLKGSYALGIVFKDNPNLIYALKYGLPLIVGIKDDENFITSDVAAILKYTKDVHYLLDKELAIIGVNQRKYINIENGLEQAENIVHINLSHKDAEKGNFPHFMLKEIYDEPTAIQDTLTSIIKDGKISLEASGLNKEEIKKISRVYFASCGSSYNVSLIGKEVIEDITKIPVEVYYASEFRYSPTPLDKNGLMIVVSQSGETADSLAALKEAKKRGIKVLSIVNVVESTIARESDYVIYTKAGIEVAVATTKAFSSQLSVLYTIAVSFAYIKGTISETEYKYYINEMLSIPEKVQKCLDDTNEIRHFALSPLFKNNAFYIGRGIDYALCMEGSLKFKEVSYIHSEAYPAGELKHGTISLIENGSLVVAIITKDETMDKMFSNVEEVKSRGARILVITSMENLPYKDDFEKVITIDQIDEHFRSSLVIVTLQLLAYFVAVNKGNDVDKPRNLAKSVTVE